MTIQTLQISYPSFQMGATIDPDQFNTNNGEIVSKVNEIKEVVNGISVTSDDITAWNNMKARLDNIGTVMYPVGAIYMSVNNVNPSTLFGGTWVAWGSGKVPIGVDGTQTEFDTVEKTGGEKTHTLTTAEMPAHSGHINGGGGTGGYYLPNSSLTVYGSGGRGWSLQNVNEAIPASQSLGGGTAHNNLQPYITCYMFKRTA